jgi:hypothetical protein
MNDNSANSTPDGFEQAIAAMRQVVGNADAIGGLVTVSLTQSHGEGWRVEAQSLGSLYEIEIIDMLRGWAQVLGGELELSEPKVFDSGWDRTHWRKLTAKATVCGAAVEIWDHVDSYTTTDDAGATSELITAHA